MLGIDGVTYVWRIEEDPNTGSLDMAHRGAELDRAVIRGDDGSAIELLLYPHDLRFRRWWLGPRRLTPEVIERAIRIAGARGKTARYQLEYSEVIEAFDGPIRSLRADLEAASAALDALAQGGLLAAHVFVDRLLEIGCFGCVDKPATDAWVVQHAQKLFGAGRALRHLLAEEGDDDERVYRNRSALAFLLEMCARNQIGLPLDTSAADARLRKRAPLNVKPWGIPHSHWWWHERRP